MLVSKFLSFYQLERFKLSYSFRLIFLCFSLFNLAACSDSHSPTNVQTKPSSATITFDISPDNATIFMPGLQKPLAEESQLGLGRYLVEFSAPGFESERLWLDIDSFQPQYIQLSLTPQSEPLTLSIWPPGSQMTWQADNQTQGVIPATGAPKLALGHYQLTFSKPGYFDKKISLNVEEGGDYAIDLSLAPKPKKVGQVFNDLILEGQPGPSMVVIPAGEFQQGDLVGDGDWREQPIRRVNLTSFAISQTEITVNQYQQYASATQRPMPAQQSQRPDLPIAGVSYEDAEKYAQWLSVQTGETYRLPTESEWEFAARAGSQDNYSFGDNIHCDLARYDGLNLCGVAEAAPVASYKPNAFGIHDMHGNLWEWTMDCASEDYSNAPTDGSAFITESCHRAMLRGGSYILNAHKLRVSYRSWRYRDYRHSDTGIRLVRELP